MRKIALTITIILTLVSGIFAKPLCQKQADLLLALIKSNINKYMPVGYKDGLEVKEIFECVQNALTIQNDIAQYTFDQNTFCKNPYSAICSNQEIAIPLYASSTSNPYLFGCMLGALKRKEDLEKYKEYFIKYYTTGIIKKLWYNMFCVKGE